VGDAGFLFEIPEYITPESRETPTAEAVAPWVETIARLWDDQAFYDAAGRRCRERAETWRPDVLLPRYERAFEDLLNGEKREPDRHTS
ncbi:MAG: hypothetical protein GXY25_16700, partial [Pirellulaceae bacterium]|nr:hypothetical protein [Pirellulaceae bacterium]